jgi:hypothetical protein
MKITSHPSRRLWPLCILAASLGTLLLGCIPSLQPLFTPDDLVFEEKLLGAWAEKDKEPGWIFSKGDEKSYQLTIKEEEKSSPFQAHLFKLQDQLYLDIYPDDSGLEDSQRETFFRSALVRGHLFFKVSQLTSTDLKFHLLDDEWLKEFIAQNPKAVAHTKVEDRLIFVASTAEMQKFLTTHAKNPKAWGDPAELMRHKKGN